jgi:SET domain-containing protein
LESYATRDIAAGEELKPNYGFDESEVALVPLGLREPLESYLDEYSDDDDDDEDEDDSDDSETARTPP